MRRLYRCRWDKKIAGVCGGLSPLLKVDSSVIRLCFATLCLFTGIFPLFILYTIASLVIPLGPNVYIQTSCKQLYRSKKRRKLSGVCGGLSEYLKIDVLAIRLIFILLTVLTAALPMIGLYILATAIVPERPPKRIKRH